MSTPPEIGTWKQFGQDLREFFQDARGHFTVFSLVSLAAGFTLCAVAWRGTHTPDYLVYALLTMFLVAVLSETLIALVIEHGFWRARKGPDTVVEQTGDVTNNLTDTPTPEV